MQRSDIRLTFHCPVQWEGMQPQQGGRFCGNCKKMVHDFTKTPLKKLNEDKAACAEGMCGRFELYQLDKPFGDWRDYVVSFYQKVALNGGKRVVLMFAMAMLVITGCKLRRTGGAIARYDSGANPRDMGAPEIVKTYLPAVDKDGITQPIRPKPVH